MHKSLKIYRKNVDLRLIIRQRIFFIIVTVFIMISITNIVLGKINYILAISGFALAVVIGLFLSRMFKIFWHDEKEKVVAQLDTVGTILLILYIITEIFRKWIFEHWLSGAELNSFILIVLTGILLGRFLGTGFRIRTTLAEEKIIK
jgi:hypothetical protein